MYVCQYVSSSRRVCCNYVVAKRTSPGLVERECQKSMHVAMNLFIYKYTHKHKHTHTHTHIYTHIYTYIHIYTHIYTYIHIYTHIHIYTYTHTHTYIYIYGQASGVPGPPPPPPNGMVWQGWGGGAGVCREWSAGWVGCCCGRPWVTGSQRGPGSYASHKPYNVGRVPVLINLNLYLILETLHPSLNPA